MKPPRTPNFVSGPWRKLFGRYDANNHILSSVLIKMMVTLGGLSQFTLRLPTLIGGFFLMLGIFWLLKPVQSRTIRWATFALVCLHPLLFDFSIAARGYGLSLAFFVWALYFCRERRYMFAGFLLGLSMGANLAILFPVLALFASVFLIERRFKPLISLVVPALLLGTLINGPSLRRAHRDDFYIGYPDLRTAVASLVSTSLHARADRDGILGDRNMAEHIGVVGVPLFLILAAVASFFVKDRRQLVPILTLVITIFGLVLARWLFDLKYPADRTCLYFVIFAVLAWAVAGDALNSRILQVVWLLPTALLVIQFSTQLQMRYFQFWLVEADDKVMAQVIQKASLGKPENSLTVSSSWMHQPSLEFYRRYLHISALKPVERFDPTPLTGFDFYVLSWGDIERAKQTSLRTIFADPEIEVVVAQP